MNPRLLRALGLGLPGLLALGALLDTFGGGLYVGSGADFVSFQYPMHAYASARLAAGELPLWNPYVLAGTPLHAGMQMGLGYPPNLAWVLLWPGAAVALLAWLHAWLFGAGGFVLAEIARGRRSDDWRSALGPLATACALTGLGPWWAHLYAGHLNFVEALAWGPWIWSAALAATRSPSWRAAVRPALLGATALGLATLAGHPQAVFLVMSGLALWLLVEAALQSVAPGPALLRGLGVIGIIALAGAALAAIQLIPSLALGPYLNRTFESPKEFAGYGSAPAASLLTAVAPWIWGSPESVERLAKWSYHEPFAFVGIGALALALAGIGGDRTKAQVGRLVLAGLFAVLSLGTEGPLFGALVDVVPGLGLFRVPGRWLVPATMLVALSAGAGVDAWLEGGAAEPSPTPRKAGTWVAIGVLVLSAAGAALLASGVQADQGWWAELARDKANPALAAARANAASSARSALFGAAVVFGVGAWMSWRTFKPKALFAAHAPFGALALSALVLVEAFSVARGHVPRTAMRPAEQVLWPDPLAAEIARRVGTARVVTDPTLRNLNQGAGHGVANVGGYETTVLAPSARYLNVIEGRKPGAYAVMFRPSKDSPLLERLAPSHVLVPAQPGGATLARGFPAWKEVARVGDRALLANPNPRPRVMLARTLDVDPDDEAQLTRIQARGLEGDDPDRVVLDRPFRMDMQPAPDGAKASLVSARPEALEIAVEGITRPCVLIVRDAVAPGWTAEVDGRPTELGRADILFRAVALPAGAQRVVMRYESPGLALGVSVSALAWLAMVVAFALRKRLATS